MALSTGQVNDAFQNALGRQPTGQELQQYTSDNSYSGSSGQQSLISRLGGSSSSGNNSFASNWSGITNPVDAAKQIVQYTQQANQPAIQTLQNQIDPLTKKYDDLITSIKGQASAAQTQGTVAQNYATQAATLDLGRRGLLPTSQEGQTAISNALLPVQAQNQTSQAQFANLLAQTGLGETQDINQINQAIATLQTGNPSQALTLASNIYNTQQQLQNQLALGSIANMYKEFGMGGGVINTQTGQTLGGGGGGGGFSLSTTPTSTETSIPDYFTPVTSGFNYNPNGMSGLNFSTSGTANPLISFLNPTQNYSFVS